MPKNDTAELEAIRAELARVTAERDAARRAADVPIRFKVSEKRALSMYGLGRFPVTLYASQWRRVIGAAAQIEAALKANAGQLAEKG